MKRQVFNKIVGVASVYYGIDFFQVIHASEILLFKIKTHFKKSNQ